MTVRAPGGAKSGDRGTRGRGTATSGPNSSEPATSEGATTVLSRVESGLSGFVKSFDPARFSGDDAATLVRHFARIEHLAQAGKVLAAARANDSDIHRRHGQRSGAEWLATETGESLSDAIDTLQLGQNLSAQPGVEDALREGKLSQQKARLISAAVKENPEAESDLLDNAERHSLRHLREKAGRARAQGRSAEDEHRRAARLRARRKLRTWTNAADGMTMLYGRFTPTEGARLRSALERTTDAVFRRAHRAGVEESRDAYMADALLELVGSGSTRGPGSPDTSGQGRVRGSSRTDTVHVRVDLAALRAGFAGSGQICEIPGVGPISVERAREIMGDALVRLVITDGVDVPTIVNLKRGIPAVVGAALLERDPTCVIESCDQNRHLQVDHWKVDFAKQGPTQWWNLVRLCGHHHRLKTRGYFHLDRKPDGSWTFTVTDKGRTHGYGPTAPRSPQSSPPDWVPDPDPPDEGDPARFPRTE